MQHKFAFGCDGITDDSDVFCAVLVMCRALRMWSYAALLCFIDINVSACVPEAYLVFCNVGLFGEDRLHS